MAARQPPDGTGAIHHARRLAHRQIVAADGAGDESRPYGLSRGVPLGDVVGVDVVLRRSPDAILTAHIGLPAVLSDLAARMQPPLAVVAIDACGASTSEHHFFRAPADLVLPGWPARRLVAAAAVVRPGDDSFELVCSDAFEWPGEATAALRELERTILAHVDQWHPPRALWAAPAEILLPEVLNEAG